MSAASSRDVILVHSSDLHLGSDSIFDPSEGADRLPILRAVLRGATDARADLVILAGDTFDNNRQDPDLLGRAAAILNAFPAPIVILPGNHDPLTPDSVYRRAEFTVTANVRVIGLDGRNAVVFPKMSLEVWGNPHLDYSDMSPLSRPRTRSTRWQLAAAHGHYVEEAEEPGRLLGSWLIRPEDLRATGADYVALGHWNRAARVGDGRVNAYYSGSPDFAGTVNVVSLRRDGAVEVTQAALPGISTHEKPDLT